MEKYDKISQNFNQNPPYMALFDIYSTEPVTEYKDVTQTQFYSIGFSLCSILLKKRKGTVPYTFKELIYNQNHFHFQILGILIAFENRQILPVNKIIII